MKVNKLVPFVNSRKIALILVLFSAFLYVHPYNGIRHDSILYLGQALLRFRPDLFADDLFFKYGSQADFTVFPVFFGALLKWVSPEFLFLFGTVVGLILFFVSTCFLLFQFYKNNFRLAVLAVFSIVFFPSGYGGFGIFAYGEPFLTSRLYAESFVLLALWAYFNCRAWVSFFLLILGFVLHPLQAIPGCCVIFVWLLLDLRWGLRKIGWVLGGIAAPLFVITILKGSYDNEWYDWIIAPNKNVFVGEWDLNSYFYVTFDFLLLYASFSSLRGRNRFFVLPFVVLLPLSFFVSFVLVDLFKLVLPAGLQLWRFQWLAHYVAVASIPYLFLSLWRARHTHMIKLLSFVAMLSVGMRYGALLAPSPLVMVFLVPLYFFGNRLSAVLSGRFKTLLFLTLFVVIVVSLVKYLNGFYELSSRFGGDRQTFRPEFVLLLYPLISVPVFFVIWHFLRRFFFSSAVAWTLVLVCLGYSVSQFDRRIEWTRYIESAENTPTLFGVELRAKAQVFWAGELLAPWLILSRSAYYDGLQTAGLLFNRLTAQEAVRRNQIMEGVNFQRQICQVVNGLEGGQSCLIDRTIIAEACRNSNGELGYLVLDVRADIPELGSWQIKGGLKNDKSIVYWLYDCGMV